MSEQWLREIKQQPELSFHLLGRGRHEWMKRQAQKAKRLGGIIEHGVQPRPVLRRLGQGPRRAFVDVLISRLDQPPDGFEGTVELKLGNVAVKEGEQFRRHLSKRGVQVQIAGGSWLRDLAIRIPLNHRQRPMQQVAEIIGQVAIDAGDQCLSREVSVLAEGNLTQEKVAERVHAEFVHDRIRVDHVPAALRHLLAIHRPPAVRENRGRRLQFQCLEHGRPVDGMGGENVLADEMHIRRPPFGEAGVVHQIARHGNVVY